MKKCLLITIYPLLSFSAVNEKDRTIELSEGNYFAEGGK